MPLLAGIIERLGRPPEDIRAENLRRWVKTVPGATPIAEVRSRDRCRVAGVIQNIRIDPREGRTSIEATIIDGSGQLIVKWWGRHDLSGIHLGTGLVVDGVAGKDHDGELVVLNPEYRLIPHPEHG